MDERSGRQFLKDRGYTAFICIDTGGQGNVYKTTKNKITYACKVIRAEDPKNPDKLELDLRRELAIMKNLRHPNCIHIEDLFRTKTKTYIVMEFMPNGNVGDLVRKEDGICEWNAKSWFCPIARAVRYLHQNGVVHRDLKLDNILLDSHMNPVLTDFGFSRFCKYGTSGLKGSKIERCETFCGTPSFYPPEINAHKPYDPFKADVWCLGVCLFIMLNKDYPFDRKDKQKMLDCQMRRNYKFRSKTDAKISKDVKQLVNKLLEPNAVKRINIEQVCTDHWFPKDQIEK